MEEFVKLGVRSIILTSGTLSPLESCAQEMNLEFPVRLENPHVVSPDQVWVGVLSTGPSGYSLNSSYRTRDSLEYKQELGNTIVNFSRIVPDGLLVFFPSYYLMDQCIECWKNMGHARSSNCITIWERICKHKQPVIEPKQSTLFPSAIENFEAKLRDRTTMGAIFFAVCRGKVSEGLDFADQSGRGVMITGMPFSMRTDPKVRLKREYMDQQASLRMKESKEVLTGENWYVQQAARAVNQAIGRVIRHRDDYGAIVLCDERFAQQNYQCQFSYWLRSHVKCYPKFGEAIFKMTKFFRERETSIFQKPNPINSLTFEKIVMKEEPILASNSLTCLSPSIKYIPIEPPTSQSAVSKEKVHPQLWPIMPANHSTLSSEQNQHSSGISLRDRFFVSVRKGTLESSKSHVKVADLTIDKLDKRMRQDDNLASPSVSLTKIPKLVKASSCKLVAPENCCKQSFFSPCSQLKAGSFGRDKIITNLISPINLCNDQAATSAANESVLKKEVQNGQSNHGEELSRGSVFLTQVQEKLTTEEYIEFVRLMRALKSKAMNITSVLQSIATLFSSPGRLSLLKGFKDFVPEKYRPLYEQHLRAHIIEDG